MKVIYFGFNEKFHSVKTIKEEALRLNWEFVFINVDNLFFYENKLIYRQRLLDISQFNGAIVRCHDKVVDNTLIKKRISTYRLILFLRENSVPVVNGDFFAKNPFFDKFSQYELFLKYNIPTIDTLHPVSQNSKYLLKVIPWSFPIILKDVEGSFGLSVHKMSTEQDLVDYVAKNPDKSIILQEFIPTTCDYRVIVCAGKTIGAIKRSGTTSDWKHNFSQGASIESYYDVKMFKFAENVAQKLLCDYVGVDIIVDSNKRFRVIEINLSANFKGFQIAHSNKNIVQEILAGFHKSFSS